MTSKMLNEAGQRLQRTYAPDEEGLFAKKEGPLEPPVCNNCRHLWRYHLDQKCPFEASDYDPGEEPYLWTVDFFMTYEEPGVAIGNVASVNKIKL